MSERSSLRVERGGIWTLAASYVRSAERCGLDVGNRFGYLGFRIRRRLR